MELLLWFSSEQAETVAKVLLVGFLVAGAIICYLDDRGGFD